MKPRLTRIPPIFCFVSWLFGATMAVSIVGCAAEKEPVLFPISVEGKWGYIDAEGSVVIEPQFLKANAFSEGLAVVAVAGTSQEDLAFERKYQGFIDPSGQFVIPPQPPREAQEIEDFWTYSYDDFHGGLARIHINDATGMDGYIDRSGKLVVPAKFDTFAEFSEGLAFASTWRHWDDPGPKKTGYIDKQGRFVIENNDFTFGYPFQEGRAVVSVRTSDDDTAYGLIDNRGQYVIAPGVYTYLSTPVNGAIRAVKDGQVGLIDINGEVIVSLGKYEQILVPTEGDIFTAESDGKVTLIDATGRRLAEVAEPGDVGRFRGSMATIKQDGSYGYIDASGAMRIAPKYDRAQDFDRGLALVSVGDTKGYINAKGEFVWKTDRWDEPLRNSVSKPLSTFLPESTLKALPLSYNWERVRNAIVFVADGDLKDMRGWYKKRYSGKLKISDHTDFELEPDKLDMMISRPDAGFLEIYAMAGTGDKETVDGFVDFYSCDNMDALRKQYPKKIVGILIEN